MWMHVLNCIANYPISVEQSSSYRTKTYKAKKKKTYTQDFSLL